MQTLGVKSQLWPGYWYKMHLHRPLFERLVRGNQLCLKPHSEREFDDFKLRTCVRNTYSLIASKSLPCSYKLILAVNRTGSDKDMNLRIPASLSVPHNSINIRFLQNEPILSLQFFMALAIFWTAIMTYSSSRKTSFTTEIPHFSSCLAMETFPLLRS